MIKACTFILGFLFFQSTSIFHLGILLFIVFLFLLKSSILFQVSYILVWAISDSFQEK